MFNFGHPCEHQLKRVCIGGHHCPLHGYPDNWCCSNVKGRIHFKRDKPCEGPRCRWGYIHPTPEEFDSVTSILSEARLIAGKLEDTSDASPLTIDNSHVVDTVLTTLKYMRTPPQSAARRLGFFFAYAAVRSQDGKVFVSLLRPMKRPVDMYLLGAWGFVMQMLKQRDAAHAKATAAGGNATGTAGASSSSPAATAAPPATKASPPKKTDDVVDDLRHDMLDIMAGALSSNGQLLHRDEQVALQAVYIQALQIATRNKKKVAEALAIAQERFPNASLTASPPQTAAAAASSSSAAAAAAAAAAAPPLESLEEAAAPHGGGGGGKSASSPGGSAAAPVGHRSVGRQATTTAAAAVSDEPTAGSPHTHHDKADSSHSARRSSQDTAAPPPTSSYSTAQKLAAATPPTTKSIVAGHSLSDHPTAAAAPVGAAPAAPRVVAGSRVVTAAAKGSQHAPAASAAPPASASATATSATAAGGATGGQAPPPSGCFLRACASCSPPPFQWRYSPPPESPLNHPILAGSSNRPFYPDVPILGGLFSLSPSARAKSGMLGPLTRNVDHATPVFSPTRADSSAAAASSLLAAVAQPPPPSPLMVSSSAAAMAASPASSLAPGAIGSTRASAMTPQGSSAAVAAVTTGLSSPFSAGVVFHAVGGASAGGASTTSDREASGGLGAMTWQTWGLP